jgi:cell division protein FtsB
MTLTRAAVVRLGLSALILYLAAHGLTGRQGLISFLELQEREHALQMERADLEARIAELSDRAGRLRAGSVSFDRDYLEERARTILDAAYADEVVIDLRG